MAQQIPVVPGPIRQEATDSVALAILKSSTGLLMLISLGRLLPLIWLNSSSLSRFCKAHTGTKGETLLLKSKNTLQIPGLLALVLLLSSMSIFAMACDTEPIEVQRITARELYAEREANATRFDQQRKGSWVRVSGLVSMIDNGRVYLAVDEESFNWSGIAWETVDLNDLSVDVQASAKKGKRFTATCKVNDFILGSMQLRDCRQ